jgi:hypothetical protein
MSSKVGQCSTEGFYLWMDWKELGIAQLDYFHFIQHAPLNCMVFLYSRNTKNNLKHRLSFFKDPSFELIRIGGLFSFSPFWIPKSLLNTH